MVVDQREDGEMIRLRETLSVSEPQKAYVSRLAKILDSSF